MENKEKLEKIKQLTKKEISLSDISQQLGINEYEVMALIRELRLTGINIVTQQRDDDIYMYNHSEKEISDENSYQFYTDEENEFKFVAISDTRFGSKSQQLSILNNIYSESNFLDDTLRQVDYITEYYPAVEGMTTYFITGAKDEKHLQSNQINIGKRIEILESDFKPKILLIGHYHKSYSFVYRNVRGIEVPRLCAKTQFQQKQVLSNVIGTYFLNIYSDSKGNIQYFEPEEILFRQNEIWDEAGKDKNKVKKLVIE